MTVNKTKSTLISNIKLSQQWYTVPANYFLRNMSHT